MSGEKGLSHILVGGLVAVVAEAIVHAALSWLKPHEFWEGVGMAIVPTMVVAYLLTESRRRNSDAELANAKREIEARDAGLEILHKAAEAVRRAAIASRQPEGYSREQFSEDVHHLLETRLREYLHARLGSGPGVEYAVTIKWIHPNAAGQRSLIPVFRDKMQETKRQDFSDERLKGNYFYEKFSNKEHIKTGLLCLPVHNALEKDIPAELKTRALDREYRSCLVIPLNIPVPEPLEGGGLVGFLSVDAKETWAFAGFFDKVDATRGLGCTGENHRAKRELNLLYGLADAVATIYHLTEES